MLNFVDKSLTWKGGKLSRARYRYRSYIELLELYIRRKESFEYFRLYYFG